MNVNNERKRNRILRRIGVSLGMIFGGAALCWAGYEMFQAGNEAHLSEDQGANHAVGVILGIGGAAVTVTGLISLSPSFEPYRSRPEDIPTDPSEPLQ